MEANNNFKNIAFIANITLQNGRTEIQWFQYLNNKFIKAEGFKVKIYQVVRNYRSGATKELAHYANYQKALDAVRDLEQDENSYKLCTYEIVDIEVII